jgi:peptidoglycan/LPS O-acetylase OafA/YrhL
MAVVDHQQSRVREATGRYPELTSIRALAAGAVLATHAAYWTGHYVRGDYTLVFARLDFGVALFFVLSGFLLFRSWVAALNNRSAPPSVPRYFRHRAHRILPAYWIAVLVAFAVVPSDTATGPKSLLRSLTLTQVYGGNYQHLGLTQMWSLAVEVVFYLLLPPFAWLLCTVVSGGRFRPARLYAGIAVFGAVSVAWYVVTRTRWTPGLSSIFWFPGYADWFAFGMALAVLAVSAERHDHDPPRLSQYVAASPVSCWLMALALLLVASTPAAGEATLVPLPLFEALTKNVLYGLAAALILAPLVLGASGTRTTAWLRWRPLVWLGGISYELFLVHLIVIEGVMRVLDYPVFTGSMGYVLVFTVAVSIPAAWLLKSAVDRFVPRPR